MGVIQRERAREGGGSTMRPSIVTLFLVALCIGQSVAITSFFLKEGAKKCFIEDIPKDTLVDATGPSKEVLVQRSSGPKGRVAFTSKTAGEHEVCFATNSTRWFGVGTVRVDLDLVTGAETTDYGDLARAEHLSELEVFIRRLNDRVADIRREQNYFKQREMEFRDESEETNARVMWFSFAQTIVLLVSGVWQIRHLQGFFQSKKMV